MAKVMLDKERELCLDLNAIEKFHETTGVNLLKAEGLKDTFDNATPQLIKAFLWCCLLRDSPELTLEEIGRLVTFKNMDVINEAIFALAEEIESPLSESGPSVSSIQT